jgi:hypothetical protein
VHPDALAPVARGLRRLMAPVGRLWTRVLLALIYFAVVAPLGALLRLFKQSPLLRTGAAGWAPRASACEAPEHRYKKMY